MYLNLTINGKTYNVWDFSGVIKQSSANTNRTGDPDVFVTPIGHQTEILTIDTTGQKELKISFNFGTFYYVVMHWYHAEMISVTDKVISVHDKAENDNNGIRMLITINGHGGANSASWFFSRYNTESEQKN